MLKNDLTSNSMSLARIIVSPVASCRKHQSVARCSSKPVLRISHLNGAVPLIGMTAVTSPDGFTSMLVVRRIVLSLTFWSDVPVSSNLTSNSISAQSRCRRVSGMINVTSPVVPPSREKGIVEVCRGIGRDISTNNTRLATPEAANTYTHLLINEL